MPTRPFASAADRNATPVLEILRHEYRDRRHVLEIGSGTGQHAVTFAAQLPQLDWQPSDLRENHDGIRAWIRESAATNVFAPIVLDVLSDDVPPASYDAVYSANTAHIMSWTAVTRMFDLVGDTLVPGGIFCLYGPFQVFGEYTTESNAAFDASLRSRDPDMGLRDLEELDRLAASNELVRKRIYAVPSNNLLPVWKKTGDTN